jgi:uncharacterized protein with GYD domain
MPKYLYQGSYTPEGVAGLVKDKASGRRQAIKTAVKALGGKLEAMYYSFGADDVYVIIDLPDNIAAARLGTAVAATGMVNGMTTPLLTCEEMDEALSKGNKYKAPGEA